MLWNGDSVIQQNCRNIKYFDNEKIFRVIICIIVHVLTTYGSGSLYLGLPGLPVRSTDGDEITSFVLLSPK